MDIIEHLTKLKDVSFKQRDLLIDDLSDLFESGQISESRANMTIAAVIQLLETETDIDFLESVFNLLELAREQLLFC